MPQHSGTPWEPSHVLGYSWLQEDCQNQENDSKLSLPQCLKHHSFIHKDSLSEQSGKNTSKENKTKQNPNKQKGYKQALRSDV